MTIHIIYENEDWLPPFRAAFKELQLPFREWNLSDGTLDVDGIPPQGVFFNRMSASSHTREHQFAPSYTAAVLSWLERHGRTIINNGRALQLEVSKIAQYNALAAFDIKTPKTVAAFGRHQILKAAETFTYPLIVKHNCSGKGLGVRLFNSRDALAVYIESDEFDEPIDGITLVQQYIQSADSFITRCEFIGGKFYYAVRVDSSKGFELCPADVCTIEETCAIDGAQNHMFDIQKDFSNPLISQYEKFLAANSIQVAGIEFIQDVTGTIYTYDVNTNTNYNPEAEARAGMYGCTHLGKYLGSLLTCATKSVAA